jgi:hypothetical protein
VCENISTGDIIAVVGVIMGNGLYGRSAVVRVSEPLLRNVVAPCVLARFGPLYLQPSLFSSCSHTSRVRSAVGWLLCIWK